MTSPAASFFRVGVFLALAIFSSAALADERLEACSFHAGLPARIVSLSAQGRVWVAHGNGKDKTSNLKLPCWLEPGDSVTVDGDSTTSIVLWSGQQVNLTSRNNPYEIAPPQEPPGWAVLCRLCFGLVNDIMGKSGMRAYEIAHAAVGASRGIGSSPSATSLPSLLGAIGKTPQRVDRSRPLRLAWKGELPPYNVALASLDSTPGPTVRTDDEHAALDLQSLQPGDYRLTITGSRGASLILPVRLVDEADVPIPTGLTASDTGEPREIAQAVWLVTGASTAWRLEALSRLRTLADANNVIAQAILDAPR